MPLRDLLVVSIVLVGAALALRRPWIGVMLWTWISIMNPHRYTWAFAYSAPFAALAGGATLLGLLLTKERRSPFQGAPVWLLLLFSVWITLSWLMGLDPAGHYQQWDKVIKVYFMTFVALALLHTKHHIMAFAVVTTVSIGLLSTKGGLFTVLSGGNYLVWGPRQSFIFDNNAFALATIMAIPMLHFLQLQMSRPWMRHAMWVVILLSAASALGSHSRGALLAILAMTVVIWLRSRHKMALAAAIVVAVLAIVPMMPDHWWERMDTIQTYQEDSSAMARINAWHVAYHTARTHLTGAGMGYGFPTCSSNTAPTTITRARRTATTSRYSGITALLAYSCFLCCGSRRSAQPDGCGRTRETSRRPNGQQISVPWFRSVSWRSPSAEPSFPSHTSTCPTT
jgi:putative inorganic carbon (hco3(-)) transporter